jgi:membrane-bound acyltransferase YfiQ involved in biofilm formation
MGLLHGFFTAFFLCAFFLSQLWGKTALLSQNLSFSIVLHHMLGMIIHEVLGASA